MHIKDKQLNAHDECFKPPESCMNLTIKVKNQKQRLITK